MRNGVLTWESSDLNGSIGVLVEVAEDGCVANDRAVYRYLIVVVALTAIRDCRRCVSIIFRVKLRVDDSIELYYGKSEKDEYDRVRQTRNIQEHITISAYSSYIVRWSCILLQVVVSSLHFGICHLSSGSIPDSIGFPCNCLDPFTCWHWGPPFSLPSPVLASSECLLRLVPAVGECSSLVWGTSVQPLVGTPGNPTPTVTDHDTQTTEVKE